MHSYNFSRYFKQWKMPNFLCKKIQADNVLKEKCNTVYKQQSQFLQRVLRMYFCFQIPVWCLLRLGLWLLGSSVTPKSRTVAQAQYFLFCGYVALLIQSLCLLQRQRVLALDSCSQCKSVCVCGHRSLGQHFLRDLCAVQACPSYDPVLTPSKQH